MATKVLTRSIFTIHRSMQVKKQFLSRSYTNISLATPSPSPSLIRHRSLFTLIAGAGHASPTVATLRVFSTRQTRSSMNDSSPNWSNRPPKETILLDGCDFEHWLVVMEKPEDDRTRDEIIDSYIKTLAQVVGSEEEARMKIYSVSTKHYFAFGALVSEEVSYKIKELPRVRWVLPDSYLNIRNKDYGENKYGSVNHTFGVPNNMGGPQPNYGGSPAQNYGGPQPNYGAPPPPNYGNMGGAPNNGPNFQQSSGPNSGGVPPYQQGPPGYQNATRNMGGGNPYSQAQDMSGRDNY